MLLVALVPGQPAICRILDVLVRAAAPILCFTADEVWRSMPRAPGRAESVHLAGFLSGAQLREGIPAGMLARFENWPRLIALREEVLKALESARQDKLIGAPLEARVVLSTNGELGALAGEYRSILPTLFIVSQVEVHPNSLHGGQEPRLSGLRVAIERAQGQKCARCWNYSVHVGENKRYPAVCERCSAALREIEDHKTAPPAISSTVGKRTASAQPGKRLNASKRKPKRRK